MDRSGSVTFGSDTPESQDCELCQLPPLTDPPAKVRPQGDSEVEFPPSLSGEGLMRITVD